MKCVAAKRLLSLAAIGGAIGIAGVSTARAEDVWVSSARVRILSEPSPGGTVVALAAHGTHLQVLEHGGLKNAWLRVSVQDDKGTEEGWVYGQSTDAKEVKAGSGGLGSANASALSVGAAGKGYVDADAAKYIDAKHVSKEPVIEMERRTEVIAKQLAKFMAQGHVGANAQ